MSALRATSPRWKNNGLGWEKDDLPGPGSYENPIQSINLQTFRHGGTTFGDKKRFLMDKQWTDAGPGAYLKRRELVVGVKTDNGPQCPFLNTTVRDTFPGFTRPEGSCPGPPHYSPRDAGAPQSPRYKIPNLPRFGIPDPRVPGPGSYNSNHSVFIRSPRVATARLWTRYEQRLCDWGRGLTPGPGAYDSNVSEFLEARLPKISNPFENVSPRVHSPPRKQSSLSSHKMKTVLSPIASPRDRPPVNASSSPMDTFNPTLSTLLHSKAPIFSGNKRFSKSTSDVPGPGAYDVDRAHFYIESGTKFPQ